jgi:hypothetical protein
VNEARANKRLRSLLDAADDSFERFSLTTERNLLRSYRRTLDEVKGKIAVAFVKDKGTIESKIRRYRRLTAIERQIIDEIRLLTGVALETTKNGIKKSYMNSYTNTGYAFEEVAGVTLDLTLANPAAARFVAMDTQWLDALKKHNGQLLSDVNRELEVALRTNAREEVIAGLVEGKSYRDVTKAIEERFGVATGRAKTIAYTEMHRGHSAGRIEGVKKGAEGAAKLGIKVWNVWKHNNVGEPRPTHLVADGQKVVPGEMFNIGGVMMEAPGMSGDPAEDCFCHCNCQLELDNIGG